MAEYKSESGFVNSSPGSGLKKTDDVDWPLVKEIVCGIASALGVLCQTIPAGPIKTVICTASSLLSLICKQIPDSGSCK